MARYVSSILRRMAMILLDTRLVAHFRYKYIPKLSPYEQSPTCLFIFLRNGNSEYALTDKNKIADKRGIKKPGRNMHLQGARVLIVEDDFVVAMAANDMVRWLGGIVEGTARSVAAAKEKIRQPGLDCVMLDVNLNGDLSLGIAAELQERGFPLFSAPPTAMHLTGLNTSHAL